MQFLVPQNIDLEDKVVGPFTLKQFIYLLVGGILDYLLFLALGPKTLFVFLALIISAFFLALALLKVQDQPFPKFLQSLILYLIRPKVRTWGRTFVHPVILEKGRGHIAAPTIPPKKVTKTELAKLAQIIDTRGWTNPQQTNLQSGEQIILQGRVMSASRAQPRYNLPQQNPPKDIWQELREKLSDM